jgi:RNA polymerase sigma factor (sigma-70 family)
VDHLAAAVSVTPKQDTPARVKILLADDHGLMRAGLRALLDQVDGMEVVAEAATGREAVRLARESNPDVVLMDIAMPDINGIDATRQIHQEVPAAKIIGLSMHRSGEFVVSILKAGASGFLLKTCVSDDLTRAIRDVMANKTYLGSETASVVAETYLRRDGASTAADTLTPRQREVLQLYAEGLATKEIATRIGRSVKTIEMHRQHIMEKLQMHSLAELTKYAIRKGLVSLEP